MYLVLFEKLHAFIYHEQVGIYSILILVLIFCTIYVLCQDAFGLCRAYVDILSEVVGVVEFCIVAFVRV